MRKHYLPFVSSLLCVLLMAAQAPVDKKFETYTENRASEKKYRD